MRGTILSALLLGTAALGGCYATGDVGYRATYTSSPGYVSDGGGDVYASSPDLVTVSPGVQVVADYDEPVFYTDGFYWRYYDNGWYRSNNYAAGWSYYDRPPVAVLRIDRPHAYAHYRPQGYVVRGNRGRYRPAEPISRGNRGTVYRAEPVGRERTTVTPGTRTYEQPTRGRTYEQPTRGRTYEAQPDRRTAPTPATRTAPAPATRTAPAPSRGTRERSDEHSSPTRDRRR